MPEFHVYLLSLIEVIVGYPISSSKEVTTKYTKSTKYFYAFSVPRLASPSRGARAWFSG
jgi:hypothetical protein